MIFCVATGLVSPINVSVGSSTVVEEDSIEKFIFYSCIEVLMSKNALKVISFEQLRFSEYCFSLSRGLISSTEVSFETLIFELFFRLKNVDFFPCNRNLLVRKIQKLLCNLICLVNQNQFSPKF